MSTPIVATKVLTVGSWLDYECAECRKTFDVERHSARIAPDSPLFVAPTEKLFATMDGSGQFSWDTPAIRWMTYMTGSKTMQDSEGKRLKGTESASICLQLYRMYRMYRKVRVRNKPLARLNSNILCEIDGRGERIRTSDPLVPNQVLYQAEPLPEHAVRLRIVGRCLVRSSR